MIKKAMFAFLAPAAALNFASPAMAQVQDHYGSSQPNYYDSSGAQKWCSRGPEEQGSNGSNQNQQSTNQNQASVSRTQSTSRQRGYNAYGYAPERRQQGARQPAVNVSR